MVSEGSNFNLHSVLEMSGIRRQRNRAMGLGLACLFVAAVAAAEEVKAEDGWVQLFNGDDLTGWKVHPDDKAKWKVVDGTLVGSGPSGHLFSERGDYTKFSLPYRGQDQRQRQQRPVLPGNLH